MKKMKKLKVLKRQKWLINLKNLSKQHNGKIKIKIQETISRILEIEAPSSVEAIDKVKELYRAEDIVLDSDDYISKEIKVK